MVSSTRVDFAPVPMLRLLLLLGKKLNLGMIVWVEIYSAEVWATSQVSDVEARAIIEMLDRGDSFGNCIPTTNREWDAYAPLGDNAPIQQGET